MYGDMANHQRHGGAICAITSIMVWAGIGQALARNWVEVGLFHQGGVARGFLGNGQGFPGQWPGFAHLSINRRLSHRRSNMQCWG